MNEAMRKFHEKYIKREFCGDVKSSRASPELLAELDARYGPRGDRNDKKLLRKYREDIRRESSIGDLNFRSMMSGARGANVNRCRKS